jgi:hypothetical protein
MINLEFVEGKEEQEQNRCAYEGRAAVMCLQLTGPWHNQVPRILIAGTCFGGVPTAVGLMHRERYCITIVKTHTSTSTRKSCGRMERWASRNRDRDDRASRELILNIHGKNTTLHSAFDKDNAPMTLLGTAWSSREAPPVMRRHVYMAQGGDLVRWTGEL